MRFVPGFVFGIVLLVGCAFLHFDLGYAPVATAAAPMPFEKLMAQKR